MTKYNLNNFKNGKAFIYQEKCINNEIVIGNRICIDIKGNKLFELPKSDMIVNEFENEDIAFVMNYDGKYALLNNQGKFLTDFIYDFISRNAEEGLFCVTRNSKQGYIDINGKEVIPCLYKCGNDFSEGIATVNLEDKWGMIDFFNNTVIPFNYDDLTICYNNTIAVKRDNKWGLINKRNEILIDFLYDELDNCPSYKCFCCIAKLNNKYGLIDIQGNILEKFIYDSIEVISDTDDILGEYLCFKKNGKSALYSAKMRIFLTNFIYDNIDFSYENRFCVTINEKVGFIDTNGKMIVNAIYDGSFLYYNDGKVVVKRNGLYGTLDLSGNEIISCEYRKLGNFSENLAWAINKKGQYGYIDQNNNVAIPFGKYLNCSNFSCGLATVFDKEQGQVYINKQGEILKLKV